MFASEIPLREDPSHLQAAVDAQQLDVFCSIIRPRSTGGIVAHLQEARPMVGLLALVPIRLRWAIFSRAAW